jgi:histidine triad (HIT) family protein
MSCPFCAIVARTEPAEVVFESPNTMAFFPRDPATQGHTLVIPKPHIVNFLVIPADLWPELGAAIHTVSHALSAVLRPEGMNLISSAGEVATQSVMHVHLHVVPRWADDGFGTLWPDQNLSSNLERAEVAAALRDYLGQKDLATRRND